MAESSKECTRCKETLPLSSFHKDSSRKDGKRTQCRKCASEHYKSWSATIDRKEYNRLQNAKRKAEGHIWYKNNKQKVSKRTKAYVQKLKKETMKAYGGCCVCCGETNLIFLTLDHINNDGAKHRGSKEGPRGPGAGTYVWAREHKYPDILQVLCFNCNWAKSHGGCPHQNTSKLSRTHSTD